MYIHVHACLNWLEGHMHMHHMQIYAMQHVAQVVHVQVPHATCDKHTVCLMEQAILL